MIDNGGPAFPNITPDMEIQGGPGMSLRDYFAAEALKPYMHWSLDQPPEDGDTREKAAARYAKVAYQIADAMLATRQP